MQNNKSKIESQALSLFNECSKFGASYLSVLKSMQETAHEQKNYIKADLIQDLIIEEIKN